MTVRGEITRVEKLITDEAATRAQADIDVNEKVDLHIANKSNPHGEPKLKWDWLMLTIHRMPINQYLLLRLRLLQMLRLQVLMLSNQS